MDVLLLETEPGAGEHEAQQLRAAGHTVLRCREVADDTFDAAPCTGLAGGLCPLEAGVDVAVVAGDAPHPGAVGYICALRDGVPTTSAGHDVEDACEQAIAKAAGAMAETISTVITPLLRHADLEPGDAAIEVRRVGRHVRVDLRAPGLTDRQRHGISVRAYDAVRGMVPTAAHVVVVVKATAP